MQAHGQRGDAPVGDVGQWLLETMPYVVRVLHESLNHATGLRSSVSACSALPCLRGLCMPHAL
jgi:hypothetical protein